MTGMVTTLATHVFRRGGVLMLFDDGSWLLCGVKAILFVPVPQLTD